MPITSVSKDPAALTMTVVADFPVPVQRLWDAYADPRQLELFWGPPTYPARFTRHADLATFAAGRACEAQILSDTRVRVSRVIRGTVEQMIGMDGPPATNELTLTPVEGGTLLSLVITYPSAEVRDMVLATGMTGGMETSYARLEVSVLQAA